MSKQEDLNWIAGADQTLDKAIREVDSAFEEFLDSSKEASKAIIRYPDEEPHPKHEYFDYLLGDVHLSLSQAADRLKFFRRELEQLREFTEDPNYRWKSIHEEGTF